MDSRMISLFIYFLTVLIWGTTWLAVKFQLGEVSPEISIFYRFAAATMILFVYCKIKHIHLKFTLNEHFFLFLLGFSMFSIHYIFIYKASLYLISGLVSLIFSFVSLFNIFNSYIFFKVKSDRQVVLGVFLGLIGIIFFFWRDIVNVSLKDQFLTGIGLALIGALLFSLGNMISRRNQKHGLELIPSTTVAMGYGMLIIGIYSIIQKLPFILPQAVSYWIALLYLAIPGSVIAFLCYLKLIERMGPERAGYVTVLFPVVAIIISIFIENYHLELIDLAGLGLITAGNCLMIFKRSASLQLKNG